ncbi:hypothetical protein ECANGB1_74 [Enterospora canceri]|uniref:Transposase Tc1-like domain-containing protein n=1 Tax=Enterospora canceri TaxID=1081671 RepID=A0A1Y1S3N1_9MICR|nr:hypothetical protein ECANGB1_74 [Enterospora canceri]
MKRLSKEKIELINVPCNSHLSNRKLAVKLGLSEQSVRRFRIKKSKNLPGRPNVLSKKETNVILRKFGSGLLQVSSDGIAYVAESFDKKIEKSTIRKLLIKNGFRSNKKLKDQHYQKRI